ncbi:glycosyl-transferase for dystroglycan-domain-containing protein [Pilobolus umbonatus]|nr:glycosyl-transferase for dystroglycan-domain-containing protein [Pilobolus umbonatus]
MTLHSQRLQDDKKKPFYQPRQPLTRTLIRYLFSIQAVVIFITLFALVYLASPTQKTERTGRLRDQPGYKKHSNTCSVTLCNPSNKCSTWLPGRRYTWDDLSQANVFRDLSSIEVQPGCELVVKVEEVIDNGEWIHIPVGRTECKEQGYGVRCRNLIDIELKEDILTIANYLKKRMKDRRFEIEEVTMVHHPMDNSDNMKLDVSLISQFSVNRLETFKDVIRAWPGPISIAIYLSYPDDIDQLIRFFQLKKNLDLYSRVTLSIVKPNYLNQDHLAYPINHLRNIAIAESSAEYILVIDADFVPTTRLYDTIRFRLIPYIFYQSSSMPETAWVVPCFAIREAYNDMPIPDTYEELRRLIGRDIAYVTDPGAGHGPTLAVEIAMVRQLMLTDHLAYEVCYESQWEPYYVLHRSAPLYDVRFRNQGGDKQSHTLQLNAEGYRFMVLRDVFMIHKDHAEMVWPSGGFEMSQKTVKGWSYFDEYFEEIEEIYGKSARWPRGCSATAIGWQDQRRGTLGIAVGA